MLFRPCYWIILFLPFSPEWPRLWAQTDNPLELSPATVGIVYAHAIGTSKQAQFRPVESNSKWLSVTPDGVLTGKPDEVGTARITVEACWQGQQLRRTFTIRVLPSCLGGDDAFEWHDGSCAPVRPFKGDRVAFAARDDVPDGYQKRDPVEPVDPVDPDCEDKPCIVQFHRLLSFKGEVKKKRRVRALQEGHAANCLGSSGRAHHRFESRGKRADANGGDQFD